MTQTEDSAQAHLEQFSYQASKDGAVFIMWRGRTVATLRGPAAERFLAKAAALSESGVQLLLARLSGNFKRGNERGRQRKD